MCRFFDHPVYSTFDDYSHMLSGSFESSNEKADRVSKACRQIQLTHHSKPAYLHNVSVAYDILCQNKGQTSGSADFLCTGWRIKCGMYLVDLLNVDICSITILFLKAYLELSPKHAVPRTWPTRPRLMPRTWFPFLCWAINGITSLENGNLSKRASMDKFSAVVIFTKLQDYFRFGI